jgi:hypothetical protein
MTHPVPGIVAVLLLSMGTTVVGAQAPPGPPPSGYATIPLQVQVVIARSRGDKKISSVPYALSVSASNRGAPEAPPARLRINSNVAVPAPDQIYKPPTDGAKPAAIQGLLPVTYQRVGTNIDCSVKALAEGRFEVNISINDTALIALDDIGTSGSSKDDSPPVIRTFDSQNTVFLRDGQTTQFTSAAHSLTGEVFSIDVTLRVVK